VFASASYRAPEDYKPAVSSQKTTGSAATEEAVDDWAAVPEKPSKPATDHRAPTSFGMGFAVMDDLSASLSGGGYFDDSVQGLAVLVLFFRLTPCSSSAARV
jgi:hypothetical protein